MLRVSERDRMSASGQKAGEAAQHRVSPLSAKSGRVTKVRYAEVTNRVSVDAGTLFRLAQEDAYRQSLHFDNEADAASLGSVGNSSRATIAILALFFLCEPSRLGRRPSAYHAAYEEAPSGQSYSHGVLPYWKAADEDGSFIIHGSLHLSSMETRARFAGATNGYPRTLRGIPERRMPSGNDKTDRSSTLGGPAFRFRKILCLPCGCSSPAALQSV
jgi:hypothetical protein